MRAVFAVVLLVGLVSGCSSKSSSTTCSMPTVSFRSPMMNQTVFGNVPVQLDVAGDCKITSVALSADGVIIATLTESPFSTFWDTTMIENGNHALEATATDSQGNVGQASAEVFTLQQCAAGQPCAPSVRFLVPVDGASVCGKITLAVDARDAVSAPTVSFLADGQALGTAQTQAPYLQDWDLTSVSPGMHVVEADVANAAGLKARAILNLNVIAPGSCTPQGPVLAIACPTPDPEGQLACASTTTTLCVDVHDSSPVTSVSYAVNGTPLTGTASGPQWTLSWDTTAFSEGTYQVQVVANDSQMLSAHQSVGVTIDRTPPTIAFTQPSTGTQVSVGAAVQLTVAASDGSGCGIANVTYQFAGPATVPNVTVTTNPFSTTWDTSSLASGTYMISAIATDRAGLTSNASVMVTLM